MKNYLMATLVALSMSGALFSQDSTTVKKKTFDLGARIGANFYAINAEDASIHNRNLYVGLFTEKQLSQKFSLQLEANYSWMSILQIPVLLKYNITDKFQIYGGGSLDFSFEQRNTLKALRNKRFGASLIFGAQYHLDSHWFIEGRYVHGLTNQIPFLTSLDSAPIYGKTRTFSTGIGYKF